MNQEIQHQLTSDVVLRTSDDKLEAFLSAPLRRGGMANLEESDLVEWLALRDVTFGLDAEAIQKIAKKLNLTGDSISRQVVARGVAPEKGADGFVDYRFSTSLAAGRVETDGHVDFRERNVINNAESGAVVAVVVPPQAGTPGTSIYGQALPAKPGREAKRPVAGSHIRQDEDSYVAEVEGHVSLDGNRIQVQELVTIATDIDYHTGNIDFVGDLEIRGSVLPGFEVKARGNVKISDSVERNASVVAGGDIRVGDTIRCGKNQANVVCEGSLYSKRIESGFVQARGDVVVREEVLNSRIRCLGRFLADTAEVRGSDIEAVEGIDVGQVGSHNGADNIFTAGLNLELAQQLNDQQERCKELNKAVITLKNLFREKHGELATEPQKVQTLSPEEKGAFEKAQQDYEGRLEVLKQRIAETEEAMAELGPQVLEIPGTHVAVAKKVFPTCTIRLRWNQWVVRKAMTSTIYYDNAKYDRIGTRSYKKASLVKEEQVENGPSIDEDAVEELTELVASRRIPAAELGRRLNDLADADTALLPKIVATAANALKQKRYHTPDVFAGTGALFFRLAREKTGKDQVALGVRAVTFLKKVFGKNNMHADAWSTLGQVYEMLGKVDEALNCHGEARRAATVQKGLWNTPRIDLECASCLIHKAEALSAVGQNDQASEFRDQARERVEAALKGGATGTLKERCHALLNSLQQ